MGSDQSSSRTDEAREKASEYAEKARETASEYGEKAKEQAEMGKDQAASGMEKAAEMMRDRVGGSDGGVTAQAGTKVADTMENAASYLREHDTTEMWSDVETFARTHPTQALAGAVVAGFLLGRLIR
jgi:vacuolar-type H+-ATPase subunit H